MKKLCFLFVLIISFSACKPSIEISPESEYDSWKTTEVLKNSKGFLMKIDNNNWVIVKESTDQNFNLWSCALNPSERFVADNLPDNLKTENETKIIFSGEVKESPNFVRLMGTPLKLTKIRKQ